MHSVSTLWQELIQNPLVCKNEKIIITGTEYGVSQLVGGTVSEECMSSTFEIGTAVARELQVNLFPTASISRTAKIERYVQLVLKDSSGIVTSESEWIPKGTFYIDTRVKSPQGMYTLTAYDSMLKTDTRWWDSSRGTGDWPMSMASAVADIASTIGVEVDDRTVINSTYTVDYPNDRTMREVLCDIAAAHGGVWVITDANKLRLITFATINTSATSGYINIGSKVGHFESSDAFEPITRVTLYWDDENAFTSPVDPEDPSDTGREIVADCLSATQAMADNLLVQLEGFQYQPYTSNKAWLDPAYEIGDVVYIRGMWLYLINVSSSISTGVICSVSAPYEQEVDHEFPYVGTVSRNLKRKVVLGQNYYGVSISRDKGIYVQKTDGETVSARAIFNSDTLALQALKDGVLTNSVYFDAALGTFVFDGELSATLIQALSVLISPNLYAEKATISELTVDQLDTSTKVQKFLAGDKSDVNYQKIYDQFHNFVTASTDGTATAQATDRNGNPLYWTDNTHAAASSEVTAYPVYTYNYTELAKLSICFREEPESGQYMPMIELGAGIGDGDKGKGFIYKGVSGLYLDYYNNNGELRRIILGTDGIVITPYELERLDFYANGFSAKYSAETVSLTWTKDGNGRITALTTEDNVTIPVNWHTGDM